MGFCNQAWTQNTTEIHTKKKTNLKTSFLTKKYKPKIQIRPNSKINKNPN